MPNRLFLNLLFWRKRVLPVLLQTEAAECGLVCLCMLAQFWGHKIDLSNIRHRFTVSLRGTNLSSLAAISKGLGLDSRALRLDLDDIHQLELPCIVHWRFNHFVVLKKVGKKNVVIHDPSIGSRTLPIAEFSKSFTGIALELKPSSVFTPVNEVTQYTLGSLTGRIVGLYSSISQLLVFGFILQLCTLLAPFYIQWIVDEALVANDQDLITVLGCGFLLLVLLQTVLTGVRSWTTSRLSIDINFQWLGNVFSHLLHLPLKYFQNRSTGDIVSRFNSILTVQRTLTTQFVDAIIDGVFVLFTLAVMFIYSVKLAAVSMVAVTIYVLLRFFLYNKLKEATSTQILHSAKQQTNFIETLRGIQSIRLFDRGNTRHRSWLNMLADQFNADLQISRLSVSHATANYLLFNSERVLIIWLAALSVTKNDLSVGMMFAYLSYREQFSQRIGGLVDKFFEFRMLDLHGSRIADIVMSEKEDNGCDIEIDTSSIVASVEFKNVSFRYSDLEPFIIKNVSFKILPNLSVAIVGKSGSGKTTLLKLLLGLLTPTEGEILIGGKSLKKLGNSNYRKILGTVMQDDTLFAGTISENISFFAQDPDIELIEKCARIAGIYSEIDNMPMGFNTIIGDIGTGLSGGQTQRLLLARALYSNPRILVLDEATSNLDVDNEELINSSIQGLCLTRVLVAHRPQMIALADRVIEIKHGSVVRDSAHFSQQRPIEKNIA